MSNLEIEQYRNKRRKLDWVIWIFCLLLLFYWLGNSSVRDGFEASQDKKQVVAKVEKKPFECPAAYLDKNEKDICAENNVVEVLNWRVEAGNISRKSTFIGREICFDVFLRNLDDEAREFSETDFRLRWPSGQVHDFWTDFSSGGTLESAPLASGGYAEGKVCFEDPREKGEYMLIFKPSLDKERGIWFYNI